MKRYIVFLCVAITTTCYGKWPLRIFNENDMMAGIGTQIELIDEGVRIIRVIPGAVAEKMGIVDNDVITEIDGESVKGMNLQEVVLSLRGRVGTKVKLSIKREVVLKRDVIKVSEADLKEMESPKKSKKRRPPIDEEE